MKQLFWFYNHIAINAVFTESLRCHADLLLSPAMTDLYAVNVKRHNVVRCRGSQECGSRNVNFACKFHWRWHAVFGSSHNSEICNIGARATVGLREPGNHDNGASDLWTLTAY